jgi:hypothetical protein
VRGSHRTCTRKSPDLYAEVAGLVRESLAHKSQPTEWLFFSRQSSISNRQSTERSKTMKYAAYLRISLEDQRDNFSIDAQRLHPLLDGSALGGRLVKVRVMRPAWSLCISFACSCELCLAAQSAKRCTIFPDGPRSHLLPTVAAIRRTVSERSQSRSRIISRSSSDVFLGRLSTLLL